MKILTALLLFIVLLYSGNIYSQRYWIASTSSNWNNTANWSTTSGGAGGASVPGASDAVIFNGAGGLHGNCVLDIIPAIASLTVNGYSGTIDLNGFNLGISGTAAVTFTTGIITNNGAAATLTINTTGIVTFNGTQFGTSTALAPNVTCTAAQLYLNGSVFYGTTYLEKNGATNNLGAGGNVFHGLTTLANSGSAYLATALTTRDIFNGDLTVTNTGSSFIGLADNTLNNMFNGNITLNSSGSGSGFFTGILFANGPGAAGTKSSYLAAGKTLRLGTGYSSGSLLLAGLHQADAATAQSLTLTGSSVLYIGPSSSFAGNADFRAPQVYLQGCTYSGTAYLQKTGGTNNLGNGGNTFNSTATIVNSGGSFFATGYLSPDVFNGDLTITNTGAGWVALADNASGSMFNGNITINSSNNGANAGITFGNGPGTNTAATLASGKTINVGTGFSAGRLILRRFVQTGSTAQSFTFTGTGILNLGPYSTFNGAVTFTAPQVYLNGCTYNGTASITKSGATNNSSDGGNIFQAATTLTNNSTAQWLLANTTGDTFNSTVTFAKLSSGALLPANNQTNHFANNITINSSSVITFGGIVQLEGSNNQTITSPSSVPVIQRLTMSKTSGTNTLTLNTPVNIGVTATLTTGVIQTTSTNYINFAAGSTVTGASNTSYIDGPVRKTGNTAFVFPVGDASIYRSITISAPANVTDAFTAQYIKGTQTFGDATTLTAPLVQVSGCEYWTLDQTTGTSPVNVTLGWNSSDCTAPYISDLTDLRVARWTGSAWVSQGNGGVTGNASAGTIITTPAVTSFSPFALGSVSTNNPLPVKLVSFTAKQKDDHILLQWQTAWESENDFFTIERSVDGFRYETAATHPGSRQSNAPLVYSLTDSIPYHGLSYYRISQTDLNGHAEYLDTKSVTFSKEKGIAVFPNPSDGRIINISVSGLASGMYRYSILDISGIEIVKGTFDFAGRENDPYRLELPKVIPVGIYYLQVYTNDLHKTIKVIVR